MMGLRRGGFLEEAMLGLSLKGSVNIREGMRYAELTGRGANYCVGEYKGTSPGGWEPALGFDENKVGKR